MQRSLGYRPGLDGVRAVAIGLVLLNHTGLEIFLGGGNGVIVFFVLSGFLITKLMLEEWDRNDRVSIGRFYGRRAIRILPAPTVMLLTLLAASWWITRNAAEHRELIKEIVLSATYLTNMKPLIAPPPEGSEPLLFLGHMWSLAVEEQFYLVWAPLVVAVALPLRRARSVVIGLLGFALAVAVVRLGLYYLPALDPDVASIAFFSFDGFAVGAALAFALHHGVSPALEAWLARPWVAGVGLGVLGVDLLVGRWTHALSSVYVVYCSLAAAMVIGHIFVAAESPITRMASRAPVVLIGKWSYSIYLWHNPIWVFVSNDRYPDTPLVVLTLIEWSLTAVAVLVSYYLIERPLMKLRHRFATDHADHAGAAGTPGAQPVESHEPAPRSPSPVL